MNTMQELLDLLGPDVQIIEGPSHLDAGHRVLDPRLVPTKGKFRLGLVWLTPGVVELLERLYPDDGPYQTFKLQQMLEAHSKGDWGSLNAEDQRQNDRNLDRGEGAALLSEYTLEGVRVWVHSYSGLDSTCLLPEEY